ncbi:heterokaryon incompatibility protein-domain-containing protein [Fusarium oxysporum]|nr:heterokaryon incompatibility protein-domain-containing protein [Fusarium oxysporum]
MNDRQQQILQLPGGIQPHSCRHCRNLIIIDKEEERKDEETRSSRHSWQKFTLQQVCEFANSGCVMFSLQLRELYQDKNDGSFLIDGHLREICEFAYKKRLQLFYPLHPLRVPKELDDWSLEIGWSANTAACLDFAWKTKYGAVVLDEKPMTLFAHKDGSSSKRILNRPLHPKAELTTAKCWLQECLNYHVECGETAEPHMPSRLIHVGNSHCNTLCLEDTNSIQPVSYAALSYCWGDAGQKRFKTEKETLAIRKQGFDLIQLPKTLQDAVKVTRALGLDYLWVDALCIIQNSPEDKNKEISKMWQIYQNATIVISAATASHSDQGFLHERNLGSYYLSTWAIPWHEVDDESNRIVDTVFCAEGEIRRVRPEPIDSRAWTLQEHKLANRVLRFGSSQMVWRCAGGYEVDGGSNEEDTPDKFSTVDKVEMFYEWTHIVEEFTIRSITKAEDRLPAFAAVAADYAKRHNIRSDQYMAGLWNPWMAIGLLWYIKDVHDQATCPNLLPDEDESPTWSWHLARSGISWSYIPYQGDSDHLKLVMKSCQVELADDNVEYGRVKRGSLEVVGALLKIRLLGTQPVYAKPDGLVVSAPIRIRWDRQGIPWEEEFHCLEVRKMRQFIPEGIVLKQSSGVFRRVGYFVPDDQKSAPVSPIWLDRQTITIE